VQTFPGQAHLAPLTFSLVVTATDNGAAPLAAALSATRAYTVFVLDADDPPEFDASALTLSVPENSAQTRRHD
jgi:hypothetical protein